MGRELPGQLQKGPRAESLALRGNDIWEVLKTGAGQLLGKVSRSGLGREGFQAMGQRTHRRIGGKLVNLRK